MSARRAVLLSCIAMFLVMSFFTFAGDKPNIILILADDLGWTDINCRPLEKKPDGTYEKDLEDNYIYDDNATATTAETYDSTFYETPNLSRLREEGVRFTNAYACPFCSPTRMSLLTGKSRERACAASNNLLNLSLAETTIAEALDAGGTDYYCGWFGKNHSMVRNEISEQGFDVDKSYGDLGFPGTGNGPTTFVLGNGTCITDSLTDEAIGFINTAIQTSKPFFLYLPYHAPHNPIDCPTNDSDYFKDKLGLEAHWRFRKVSLTNLPADQLEDNSENTETDYDLLKSSGLSNRLEGDVFITDGAVLYWTISVRNDKDGCIKLIGSSDYLETKENASSAITGSGSRTVSAWIKADQSNLEGRIVSWGGSSNEWGLGIDSDKKLYVKYGDSTLKYDTAIGTVNWHHVVATYSTDNNGTIRLYVDGQEVQSVTNTGQLSTGQSRVRIGADSNISVSDFFAGYIDDVRIYYRALNANEIKGIENQTLHENAYYAGMIRRLDTNIGRILDHLEDENLADNTAIIFLSDNGGTAIQSIENYSGMQKAANSFSYATSNYPLKGAKGDTYEGGIRVPMIIKMPDDTLSQSEVCQEPVVVADILPTIYNIAYGEGAFDYDKHLIDGKSLRSLVEDPDNSGNAFTRTYHEWYKYIDSSWDFDGAIYNFGHGKYGPTENNNITYCTVSLHENDLKMLINQFYWSPNYEFYDLSQVNSDTGYFEDAAIDPGSDQNRLKIKLENWLESFKVRLGYDDINGDFLEDSNYDTIDLAINDANGTNNVIVLPPATFYENITINKNVTIRSVDPTDPAIVEATIINGISSIEATVTISSVDIACSIEGITVTDGSNSGIKGNGTNSTIKNCRIIHNSKDDGPGGGIHAIAGTISNCIISNNTSLSGGGCDGCTGDIQNCLISNNLGEKAGALNNCDGSIINCTIVNNITTDAGSGVLKDCDQATIKNCIIWENNLSQSVNSDDPEYSCVENYSGSDPNNISANPIFVNSPVFVDSTSQESGQEDRLYVNSTGEYIPGEIIEFNNDGIQREIISVELNSYITIDPPLRTAAKLNKSIYGWGVNPATVLEDYHLTYASPCIDEGNDNYAADDVDIDGDDRIINMDNIGDDGHSVDIGADEFTPPVYNETQESGYTVIQDAINDANDFDIIVVYPGTYYEKINFLGKAITVRSTDPDDWEIVEATVIDANDFSDATGMAVTFALNEGPDSILSGFTITGADTGIKIFGTDYSPAYFTSPIIEKCIIEDTERMGIRARNSFAVLRNNILRYNGDQGIKAEDHSVLDIHNNWIYGDEKGIEFRSDSTAEIANNTIVENLRGVTFADSVPEIKNCIFWNNSYYDLGSGGTASYSCLEDAFNSSDPNFIGSINDDPNFVDAANDDFHLSPSSPCINAGDPSGVYADQTDIDGDSRVMSYYVDMGGDEYAPMIAHLKFDETGGFTAFDSIAGNDGNLEGDPQWQDTAGVFGGALDFDGDGDYVDLGFSTVLDEAQAFTITAWLKLDDFDDYSGIVGFGDNSTRPFWMWVAKDGVANARKVRIVFDTEGVDKACNLTSASNFVEDMWTHIAVVWDNTSDYCYLYINGQLDQSIQTSGDTLAVSGVDKYLGVINLSAGGYWDGLIDDVQIYDQALSSDEIADLAGNASLTGHWKLDESTGSTALDSGINQLDGTLFGNPQWQSAGGAIDGALALDGNGDYVEITDFKGISGENSRTCCAWIKTSSGGVGAISSILAWGNINSDGGFWDMRLQEFGGYTGRLVVSVSGGYYASRQNLADGDWHHVVAVLDNDGTPNATEIELYIDGTLETVTDSLDEPIDTDESLNVQIGNDGLGNYFPGLIDDARVYNRALSSDEISDLVSNASLRGHWKLDESTGSTALDSGINQHDGTLAGNPAWLPTGGAIDGALALDGNGDYVEITDFKGISGENSRTCCAWIKTSSGGVGAISSILAWGDFNSDGGLWDMRLQEFGGYAGRLVVSVGGGYYASRQNLADGDWHHVVAVLDNDGTPDALEIKLYIDGTLETATDTLDEPIDTDENLNVQIGDDGLGNYFPGLIDDVRIFSRALSENEITLLAGH